jgi:hypothetical protein
MENKLKEKIRCLNKNNDYDCLLMYSGGKDSSYLLYHLSQELQLRVMTVTLTHNYIPKETFQNIESFTNRFSAKHINVVNNVLNHCGNHFLETWINQPDEGSLITLCTGCRLGLIKPIIETAKKENMNIVVSGKTPYEDTNFRLNLVNYPKGKKGVIYFLLGYLRLLLRNPKLMYDTKAVMNQAIEFYYYKNDKNIYTKNNITQFFPYYDNLPFDESKIVKKLMDLNWLKPTSTTNNSYWRSDCIMYAIRHYFYNQVAGYNEMKEYYGKLYESNLISKEYLLQHTNKHYEKEEIIDLLKSLQLSESSITKYKDFVKNFANYDIPFPACGGCKGLPS